MGRGAAPARLRPTVPAPRGAGSRWLPPAPGVRPARASRARLRPRGGPGGGEGRGAPAERSGPPRARAGRRGVPAARSARPPQPQHLALADSGPRGRDTSRGAAARKEGPGGRRRPGGSRRPGSPAPAGARERRLAGFPPNPKLFQPTQACSSRVSAAGGAVRERLGTHTRPPTRGRRYTRHREGPGRGGGGGGREGSGRPHSLKGLPARDRRRLKPCRSSGASRCPAAPRNFAHCAPACRGVPSHSHPHPTPLPLGCGPEPAFVFQGLGRTC